MALRVGIVGCGKIADGRVEEIAKRSAKAQVVAVRHLERLMSAYDRVVAGYAGSSIGREGLPPPAEAIR